MKDEDSYQGSTEFPCLGADENVLEVWMIQLTPQMRILLSVKALMYDGQGFWLCQKRLSKGTFRWWPSRSADRISVLAVHELQLLLWNGDPSQVRVAPPWRKIDVGG